MKPICSPALLGRQVLTFSLQQSLKVLQMSHLELVEWIHNEIKENPLLKLEERKTGQGGGRSSFAELSVPALTSFWDHLHHQARCQIRSSRLAMVEKIIDELDERGILMMSVEALALKYSVTEEEIYLALQQLQTLDPAGVGARDIQEFLLLQMREDRSSVAAILIRDYFDDLVHKRWEKVKRSAKISDKTFQKALEKIQGLKFSFEDLGEPTRIHVHDMEIAECEGAWALKIEQEDIPVIQVDPSYSLSLFTSQTDKALVRGWMKKISWIQQCTAKRKSYLTLIGRWLIQTQTGYLRGEQKVVPLKLEKLASLLQIHKTTAWRAIANKWVLTPQGSIPLERFFDSKARAHRMEEVLRKCLKEEENKLTDQELVIKLQEKGISCARRTVAKYRKRLNVASSLFRK